MHGHRSFGEGSSSQMHIDNSHRDYEARDNETNIDLYNDVNAEISDASSEEDEPPKNGDESEPDEDINDIRDFSQNGVNLHNHKQDVSEIQNHDIPYFRTLENEEDIFIEENVEAYEYLMEIPLDKWTVSHDGGKRWGVLTTNLSESFNGVLKKARGLPVTAMGYTRLDLYKLMYSGGNPHCVSLNERKCDCGKWVNLHFPCSHVMKVTDRMGGLARNFVSEHFTIESYVATYSGSFSPIGHEAYWPSPSFTMRSNEFYRRPNRPRTTRIPNEMDRGSTLYERDCGLCRQTGHDRRRCPNRN
ncbi:hypothetical protein H5410_024360 [Solanum commersonii]|uniref:SWIM-type domain-containing protein n=1 Tax=Solanum commersonii TaxID=4109 RepID=A0A9J5ZLS3_SOLCO|nr:hypothetical protein H5410_024360 [Solanum commersonii]